MKKLLNRTLLASLLLIISSVFNVSAQGAASVQAGFSTLESLINSFSQTVVVAFGSLLMAGAVVVFFMGVVQYIWGLRSGDPGKAKVGSNFMLWGLIGLFVMFSVYGIVKLGQSIFFKDQDITTITIPKIKFDSTGASTGSGNSVCVPVSGSCSNPCSMGSGVTGTCNLFGQCCR